MCVVMYLLVLILLEAECTTESNYSKDPTFTIGFLGRGSIDPVEEPIFKVYPKEVEEI